MWCPCCGAVRIVPTWRGWVRPKGGKSVLKQMERVVRGGGFTLFELLVVIVIISIILSIALPALRHSREAARDKPCMANIRSIAQMAAMYHDQNRWKWPRDIGTLAWWSDFEDGQQPLTCPRDRSPHPIRSHGLWEPAWGMAAGVTETPTLEERVQQASPPGLLMVVDIRLWCDRQKTHRNGTYTGDNAPRRIR